MTASVHSWEKQRSVSIGGTDAAAICGCSRYADAMDVFLRINRGRAWGTESVPMRWGNRLEQTVKRAYEEETGRQLCLEGSGRLPVDAWGARCEVQNLRRRDGTETLMLSDRTDPWIVATPDDVIESYPGPAPGQDRLPDEAAVGPGAFDAKTTRNLHPDWEFGIPLYERAQVEWYLGLTGMRWGSLGVFHSTHAPLLVRDFAASPELFAAMEDEVRRFWRDHVLTDCPPHVYREGDRLHEMLAGLYPTDDGTSVELPPVAADLELRRRAAVERAKEAEKEARALAAEIKALMGSAAEATIAGTDLRLTWKTVRREGYTVEPTTYRALRAAN